MSASHIVGCNKRKRIAPFADLRRCLLIDGWCNALRLLHPTVRGFAAILLSLLFTTAFAAECIVPSKPGGGFDQTCKLAQKGLGGDALRLSYLPGGIGAVAWSSIVSQRRAEPDTLVAFSGCLLYTSPSPRDS